MYYYKKINIRKRKGGFGKKGAKRMSRCMVKDSIHGITKSIICRIARREGVKRICSMVYDETRYILKVFLENVVRDAVTYTDYAKRKTTIALDVIYALKRQGKLLMALEAKQSIERSDYL